MIQIRSFLLVLLALMLATACSDEAPESTELPDEVSVVIGKKGGQVQAKGISLDIPEGALDKDVTITAKSTDKAAPANTKPISKVYEFGPAGTKFAKEIGIRFDTEKEDPKAVVYFTKESSEQEFEQIVTETKGKTASAKVKHFSLGFVGIAGSESDLDSGLGGARDASTDPADAGGPALDASAPGDASSASDAGAKVQRITVRSRDRYGRGADQTWGVYQDGDGPWMPLPTPLSAGDYEFTVEAERFGVAFVCAQQDAESFGTVILAPSSSATHSVEALEMCTSLAPAGYAISGVLTPPAGSSLIQFAHGFGGGGFSLQGPGPTYSYTITGLPVGIPQDPILATTDANVVPNKVLILRDYALSADAALDVNLATTGFAVSPNTISVGNASEYTNINVTLTTRDAKQGLAMNSGSHGGDATRTRSYVALTSPVFKPTDHYRFYAYEDLGEQYRELELMTQTSGNFTVNLPPPFSAEFSRTAGAYLRPTVSFSAAGNASEYTLSFQYVEAQGEWRHEFTTHIEPGWLDGSPTYEFTFPDLSSATGYDSAWFAPTNSIYLNTRFGVVTSGQAQGGTLRTKSEATSDLAIPL